MKLNQFFRKIGSMIKNNREGIIIKKILFDKSIILWMSFVSMYSQDNAIIDKIGKEAKIAATGVYFFHSSDIQAISNAEIITFIVNCI